MGYDIYGHGEVLLPAARAPEAIAAIILEAEDCDKELPDNLTNAVDLAAKIEDIIGCFVGRIDEDGDLIIQCIDDCFRGLSDDEWFFDAIGRFVNADFSCLEFKGEDGAQWRWEFGPKGRIDIDSGVVWGRNIKAPHIAGEVEDLIYDSATGKIRVHDDPQAVLDEIEGLLRKNGFGPFAGMEVLDVLAKAAE